MHNESSKELIKELFYVIVYRLWIILAIGCITSIALGCLNYFIVPPIYTSTSKLAVKQLNLDYMTLITSRNVLEEVISDTKLDLTTDELESMIATGNPIGSRILEISVTDYDPYTAQILVNSLTDIVKDEVARVVYLPKVKIVEYGDLPTTPDGRNLIRSFISGASIGMIVSAIIIIVIHMKSEVINTTEDVMYRLGIPVLSVQPLDTILLKNVTFKKHKKENLKDVKV